MFPTVLWVVFDQKNQPTHACEDVQKAAMMAQVLMAETGVKGKLVPYLLSPGAAAQNDALLKSSASEKKTSAKSSKRTSAKSSRSSSKKGSSESSTSASSGSRKRSTKSPSSSAGRRSSRKAKDSESK